MRRAHHAACRVLGRDARSLAATRVGLGLLLLVDALARAPSVPELYTDQGVVTRASAAAFWACRFPQAPPAWSLHALGGGAGWQYALLGLQGLAALGLLVGYRTRVATIAGFVLFLSLCQRNVLVTCGGDWALVAFLLWAMFVPLDGAWSFDAVRRRRAGAPADGGSAVVFGAGMFAFTAQLVMLLFFAGAQKAWNSEGWRSGEAVIAVLHLDVGVTAFGRWLAGFPAVVLRGLDYSVLAAEIVAPWLLVLPVSGRARALAVAFIGVHLVGFGAALDVGPLPWVVLVALLAHVPARSWGWTARYLGGPGAAIASATPPETEAVPAHTSFRSRGDAVLAAAIGVLLAHAVALNAFKLGERYTGPEWLEAPVGFLVPPQGWRMFRDPESWTSSWLIVAATREGDTEPTLRMPGGAALGFGPLSSVTELEGGVRWASFWLSPRHLVRHHREIVDRYLERQCEAEKSKKRPLYGLDIVRVQREPTGLLKESLARYRCGGAN